MTVYTSQAPLDTWLSSASVNNDYGQDDTGQAGHNTLPANYRGLIYYDLSTIPSGATILSATIALYFTYERVTTDYDFYMHRSLVQWYEGVRDNAIPGAGENASVWNVRNYNGAVAWAGGAGGASGSDWAAVATDTVSVTGIDNWFTWDVTADVQAFVDGTYTNYGWWVLGNEALVANTYKRWASAQYGTAALRPLLTVEYTTAPGPTPGSAVTCESGYESTDMTIKVGPRLMGTYTGTGTTIVQNVIDSYQHTITATGGYESASFTFKTSQQDAEGWLQYPLGRHVEVYDPSLSLVWEGFVNEVAATIGPLTARHGPLKDIANRTICVYSDDTINTQETTATFNYDSSQDYYGIWHKNVSGGKLSTANAIKAANTFLSDNCWPGKSQDVSDGGDLAVTVNCIGYNAFLDYPYTEVGAAWTVYEKIVDILAEEPNAIFSTDYSFIEANGLAVPREEDQFRTGANLIKSLVALGGASDNERRIWGIYAGRRMHYSIIPLTVEYLMYLSEGPQQIRTVGGLDVKPWNVQPGKWLQFPDLLPNLPAVGNIRNDMRTMFIESVTYTAPLGLSLQGGSLDRLPQLLARINMLRSI